MAADATLVSGQFRAKQHYDMGQAAARRRASKAIADIGKKPKKEEEVTQPKVKKKKKIEDKPVVNKTIKAETAGEVKKIEPTTKIGEWAPAGPTSPADQKKEEDTNKNATNNVTTTPVDKDVEADILESMNAAYYNAATNGDSRTQQKLDENVEELADQKDSFEELFTQINSDWLAKGEHTAYGYGNALERNPEAKEWLMGIINGGEDGMKLKQVAIEWDDEDNPIAFGKFVESPPDKDGNTEPMTAEQLSSYLERFEIDNESFNQINDLALFYKEEGETAGEGKSFDYDKARRDVNQIISSGNIHSLALDKSFGGTSFAEDLFNSDELKGLKYSDLGLKAPKGDKDGAITADDNIDDDLKNQIMNQFLDKDEYKDQLANSLTNYYTTHLQRNYQASMKMDIFDAKMGKPNYSGSATDLINSVE